MKDTAVHFRKPNESDPQSHMLSAGHDPSGILCLLLPAPSWLLSHSGPELQRPTIGKAGCPSLQMSEVLRPLPPRESCACRGPADSISCILQLTLLSKGQQTSGGGSPEVVQSLGSDSSRSLATPSLTSSGPSPDGRGDRLGASAQRWTDRPAVTLPRNGALDGDRTRGILPQPLFGIQEAGRKALGDKEEKPRRGQGRK